MTPQFTTSCYVRIGDTIKREDVCVTLENMGYENVYGGSVGDNIVVAANGMCGVDYRCNVAGCIDCGTNIDIFLDLAGMREDTYKNQLCIDERDGSMNVKPPPPK